MSEPGGRHGPALVAAAYAALALWTWDRWPDLQVDFGREAYAAWRLSEGEALYAALAWFNGPLSAYWNALWLAVVGPSLNTLFAVNLALAALATALVHRIVLHLSDPLSAATASLVVLVLCCFAQFDAISAYNFVAPYSHEATHGVIASLAAVAALARWARAPERRWLVVAGACGGLAALTKTEMALAALLGPGVAIALAPRARYGSPGRAVGWFVGAALVPVLLAFVALRWQSGALVAWQAISAPWRGAWSPIARTAFYRDVTGLDDPLGRIGTMAGFTLAWAVAVAIPAVAAFAAGRGGCNGPRASAALHFLFILYPLLLLPLAFWARLPNLGRPLPIVACIALVLAWSLRRTEPARATALLALAIEALILISKMLLNARFDHYGFVLALPALMLAVPLLIHWLPGWIGQGGGKSDLARVGALALVVALCGGHLGLTAHMLGRKTVPVGDGADAFFTDEPRGWPMRQALRDLEAAPAGETLAVFPEGALLNYLLRRPNPTPYVNFMPPELQFFGEAAMLDALRAHPPDRIALVHKDTTEYGVPLFGRDYGQALMRWVRENYRVERIYGEPPLEPGTTFGIALLARVPPTPSGAPR